MRTGETEARAQRPARTASSGRWQPVTHRLCRPSQQALNHIATMRMTESSTTYRLPPSPWTLGSSKGHSQAPWRPYSQSLSDPLAWVDLRTSYFNTSQRPQSDQNLIMPVTKKRRPSLNTKYDRLLKPGRSPHSDSSSFLLTPSLIPSQSQVKATRARVQQDRSRDRQRLWDDLGMGKVPPQPCPEPAACPVGH